MRPQLISLIIHPQIGCILSCSCLCSSIRRQGLAFLARSTMQRRLITRGDVVLRLRVFGLCCSEAGSTCVSFPPNRELSEPFRRSGTLVHITFYLGLALSTFYLIKPIRPMISKIITMSFSKSHNGNVCIHILTYKSKSSIKCA